VHRDVKPANIITTGRGRRSDYVKVVAFGLVKNILDAPTDGQLTGDLQIKGTPAFLPPEAATGEAPIDERSDISGLGCVAYWLVTGSFVFDATTPMNMAIAHATAPPEPASTRAPGTVPEALDRLILDCLAKDKTARPPSALALQQRLDAIAFAEPWSEARAATWWREHVSPAAPLPRRGTHEPTAASLELEGR
jgi:serine/threonine-protein kinase